MTKLSERLIHNVLFTTVSVFMFIFKFIVFIVVYIKKFLFLLTYFIQIQIKVLSLPNYFYKICKKQSRVVSESLPLSIVLQKYSDIFISPNLFLNIILPLELDFQVIHRLLLQFEDFTYFIVYILRLVIIFLLSLLL